LALIDKAMRHHRSGPYQIQAAIAALHARAESRRIRLGADRPALRRAGAGAAFAGGTLNARFAVSKVRGPQPRSI